MGFFTFCNAGTIEIYVYTSSRSAHLSFLRSDYITLLTRFTRTMSRELHQLVRVVRAAKIQRSYHSYHSYSFLVGTPARIGRSGTRINFRRSPRCFDTKPEKCTRGTSPERVVHEARTTRTDLDRGPKTLLYKARMRMNCTHPKRFVHKAHTNQTRGTIGLPGTYLTG